jgi:hypothetical protein
MSTPSIMTTGKFVRTALGEQTAGHTDKYDTQDILPWILVTCNSQCWPSGNMATVIVPAVNEGRCVTGRSNKQPWRYFAGEPDGARLYSFSAGNVSRPLVYLPPHFPRVGIDNSGTVITLAIFCGCNASARFQEICTTGLVRQSQHNCLRA